MSPLKTTRVIHPGFSGHHRRTADATMTATCVITEPGTGPGTFDPETGSTTPAQGTPVYDGPCRVQVFYRATAVQQAGQQVTERRYLVPVTADCPEVKQGWPVRFTDCPDDPALVGRTVFIEDVQFASMRFERDLICTDNLG